MTINITINIDDNYTNERTPDDILEDVIGFIKLGEVGGDCDMIEGCSDNWVHYDWSLSRED